MAQDSLKKDIIWNLLGTLLYALSSIVLAMGVLRLRGAAEGGVFGFGFSTLGQQIFIIPSKELVVVVLGYSPKPDRVIEFNRLLKDVIAAL